MPNAHRPADLRGRRDVRGYRFKGAEQADLN
jgi:hypothetical protein